MCTLQPCLTFESDYYLELAMAAGSQSGYSIPLRGISQELNIARSIFGHGILK